MKWICVLFLMIGAAEGNDLGHDALKSMFEPFIRRSLEKSSGQDKGPIFIQNFEILRIEPSGEFTQTVHYQVIFLNNQAVKITLTGNLRVNTEGRLAVIKASQLVEQALEFNQGSLVTPRPDFRHLKK